MFKKKWAAYAKAKKLPSASKPLTNDPMEATYIGIHMWKQAVEKAKSFDVDKVIAAVGVARSSPRRTASTIEMDTTNHHLHKPVFIGEVRADGQFNVVWKTQASDSRAAVEPLHPRQRQEEGRPRGLGAGRRGDPPGTARGTPWRLVYADSAAGIRLGSLSSFADDRDGPQQRLVAHPARRSSDACWIGHALALTRSSSTTSRWANPTARVMTIASDIARGDATALPLLKALHADSVQVEQGTTGLLIERRVGGRCDDRRRRFRRCPPTSTDVV